MGKNGKKSKKISKIQNFHILVFTYPNVIFQYFSEFCPKIEPKFDHFFLNFEFQPSLLICFSDSEIPIVGGQITVFLLFYLIRWPVK